MHVSAPSADYQGDSQVNVVGDVLSCAFGYTLAEMGTRFVGIWLPVAVVVLFEIYQVIFVNLTPVPYNISGLL